MQNEEPDRSGVEPGEAEAYDVFVSAAEPIQLPQAVPVVEALELSGYRVFFAPRDLREQRGEWRWRTLESLARSRAFVAVVSREYFDPERFTTDEWDRSRELEKPTVVVGFAKGDEVPGRVRARYEPLDGLSAERIRQTLQEQLLKRGIAPGQERAVAARISVAASALNDTPAEDDKLGFEPLVAGLEALLDDSRTALPLALGVTGRWGSGKSSVMTQLRRRLDPVYDERRLDPEVPRAAARQWMSVYFPAWQYEGRERLWAAMANAVFEQPQQRMSWLGRRLFRFRVERARLGSRRLALRILAPPAAAGVAIVGVLAAQFQLAGSLAVIAGAVAIAAGTLKAAAGSFQRTLARYAKPLDYGKRLGFSDDARRDIDALVDVLTRGGRTLITFVDDLDRLSSAHIVEVVETINQIFNASGAKSVFILGFDRDVVAASIEVAYADTVKQLGGSSGDLAFGHDFLSKVVQLSVSVPEPGVGALEALIGQVKQEVADSVPADGAPDQPVRGAAAVARNLERSAEAALDRLSIRAATTSEEVVNAVAATLERLPPNPRQIKRFDNAFRLQLYVAMSSGSDRLVFDEPKLCALGKWVVLRLRWPALAAAIEDDKRVLTQLEGLAQDPPLPPGPAADPRVHRVVAQWADDEGLLDLLRDDDETRRVGNLPLDEFIQIT